MAVYIIQCLCPNRHAIYAVAYDPNDIPEGTTLDPRSDPHEIFMAIFQQQIEEWVATKVIRPECGICNSRDWSYERRRTKWNTMEEAEPELRKTELANVLTRTQIEQERKNKN
jgi:hypothetical protein